ncbi:MAG: polyketide antibiotic transporter [Pseudonocardia sp.]|nr:polyketide antibiotic transporter [Pseudonocardia sp.]
MLVVTAGMPAVVAGQYRTTFAGVLDGPALHALATNPAIRTLFGPPSALDDAGGFTVWRTGTPLAVLVGVWAVVTTTRLLRGDEESGRWALLLAGPLRLSDLVARIIYVLAGAVVIVGAAVGAALIVAGTSPSGAVFFGAGLALVGVGFVALAALTAQLWDSRAAATSASAGILVATLLVRMVGDGVQGLSWLQWVTPFGLLAAVRPYAGDEVLPLLGLMVAPVVLGVAALVVAARRDVDHGLFGSRGRHGPRRWLLGSVVGFVVRRGVRSWVAWAAGVFAYFLLLGLLAGSVTAFLADNERFADLASAAGFDELGSVPGYAATMFALLGLPAGVFTAARIAEVVEDERTRRSVLLMATPVSRGHILRAHAGVALLGAVGLLAVAGLAMWTGARAVGAGLGVADAVGGAVATSPIVLLCLGTAVLATGWSPQVVLSVGSLPAVGGFLWQVIAQSTGAPGWVVEVSPFAHLAAVPAEGPDWASAAVMGSIAVVSCAIGTVGYVRRDLAH